MHHFILERYNDTRLYLHHSDSQSIAMDKTIRQADKQSKSLGRKLGNWLKAFNELFIHNPRLDIVIHL